MLRLKSLFPGLMAVLVAGFALGGEAIPNWPAPATWSPHSASRGVSTMGAITNPLPFIGVTPCRQYDSRTTTALPDNTPRAVTISGAPCGLPVTAAAVSLNVTVFDILGQGGNAVFKAGTSSPPTTAWINYPPGQGQIGNAGVLPLNGSNQVFFQVNQGGGSIDFTIDVNGYYASTTTTNRLGSGEFFAVYGTSPGGGVVVGENDDPLAFSSGVRGGYTGTGMGYGVDGETTSTTAGSAGVLGRAVGGATSGVHGNNTEPTASAWGVTGRSLSAHVLSAGVYGETSQALASAGRFQNTSTGIQTYLDTQVTGIDYGVFTDGRIRGTSLDIIGSPKNFAAPHPLDPTKEIKYASVEAPTVDVYFRGTGTLTNGYARIEVPDHFRLTAREGTYMTTLTPVGRAISLSVDSEGPDGIVIHGSGNTRFHYVVYAERAEIEGYEPVQRNVDFTPEALEKGGSPKALPGTTRALLIRNGTLNPDGSYNLETARAMGWVVPEKIPDAATAPK